MKRFLLLLSAVVLGLLALVTIPSFPQFQVQAQYQEYPCTSISGARCQYTSNSCPGGYLDNYCPSQPNNVKCCVPTTTACYTQRNQGKCQTVGGTQSCGTYYDPSNLCPGPQNIQCCVGQPPPPPPPTNVNATCTNNGTRVTVTWTRPSGYSYSYARIHDATTNTECSYSGVITGTSYSCNATPGHRYSYWVHTTTSSGSPYSSAVPASTTTVLCPAPTPTFTPTPTPLRFEQSTTTPGIIISGNRTANFGPRGQTAASVRGWVVGGLTYPEVYAGATSTSPTSYQYVLERATSAQVPINNIPCTLSNCTLPANLNRGVYRANGNLTLNARNFPANSNYVFLINGDLTIRGNIDVPNGSTVFFTARRDIIIPSTVGATSNRFPLPDAQIQGLLSADRNFVIQGIGNCVVGPDRMLNIEGAIVVNAGGDGGEIDNNRDLCGNNLLMPSFTVRSRIDFILNLPEFLMQRTTTFREDAP